MEGGRDDSAGGGELKGVGDLPRPSDAPLSGSAGTPLPSARAEVRPRWRRLLIAAFIVADLVLLAGFVWTGFDDARIGRDGHRVDATVVDIADGYADVEYEVDGRPVIVEINMTGARPPITHESQQVTIALDPEGGYATPANVSSSALLIENLFLAVLVIIGFDAVVLCTGAVCVALDRRLRRGYDTRGFAGRQGVTGDRLVVPLRCWGVVARSSIEVTPTHLVLDLPRYFGSQSVVVNLTDVSLVDGPADPDVWVVDERDALPKREAVVPSFPTRMVTESPNLTLLFGSPVRIPPLRWFTQIDGVTVRGSRRPEGAHIDGMALMATDPAAAIQLLTGLGVPTVDDPIRWMIDTFGQRTDPTAVHERRRELRRRGWLEVTSGIAALAVFIGGWALSLFGDDDTSWVPIGALLFGVAVMAASAAGAAVLRRRHRRSASPRADSP